MEKTSIKVNQVNSLDPIVVRWLKKGMVYIEGEKGLWFTVLFTRKLTLIRNRIIQTDVRSW